MSGNKMYDRRVLLLVIFFAIIKMIISASVDLGNDESYYWLYSQQLKWNYFDHPPMVAIWIKIFTANLLLEKYELFLRLGSVVACGLSTWFMYKCVSRLSTPRAGWFAACLYNASFYAAITSGLFIFPDTPQMVFYTFSLWMIAEITLDEKKWLPWILFGIGSGLCIMSKVHGVFLWIGLGMYIVIVKRNILLNTRLYAALAISLIITSPILIWNIINNFLTYRFDSERIIIKGFGVNWYSFFNAAFRQFIINNPFNMALIFLALLSWRKHKMFSLTALSVFNFIGISLGIILLGISLYRFTLPHWSGPAYVTLLPLAAIWLSHKTQTKVWPWPVTLATAGNFMFLVVCTLVINYYPGTFGSREDSELGNGDITLDMQGWKEAGKKFAALYNDDIKKGVAKPNSPVVCNTWWGAHEEYYFCREWNIKMIGLGNMQNLHEYMWINNTRKDAVNFTTAYCIVHSDENYNVYSAYKNYYSTIDTAAVIRISRSYLPSHNFYVFRLAGFKNHIPYVQ